MAHLIVDELKFSVFPVMAGAGTPLFRPGAMVPLRLATSESHANGVVELTYTR